MLFDVLATTSRRVAATSKRNEKVAALATAFGQCSPGEIEPAVAFATGTTTLGRVGVGWATIHDVVPAPAAEATLSIADVDRVVHELAAVSGSGSVARRRDLLADVLGRATDAEQAMLRSIVGGELRQGALDGVVAAAVAKAAGVKVGDVRRAAMFAGSLPAASRIALTEGADGLSSVVLRPATPVQPMLASPAADVAEAIEQTGVASVEWKLDGARIQVHRSGDVVRVFTRNLNDVSERLGGVVEIVRDLPGGDLVLDGEVLGVGDDGTPRRFQDTMGDFGADAGDTGDHRGDRLRPFFFDVLHADEPVVDEPLSERRRLLAEVVPEVHRLPSIVTSDPADAAAFLDLAISQGHEGVMVKDLASTYDAGRRGGAWRKVKPVHTLDLVVLAAEWGHGRRQGWLSNLHLGARAGDAAPDEFVMVGKTFKGLTDELLAWQTARLLEIELGRGTGRDGHVVHVRPELVVEIALDGVQISSRYPGGVALRFARVRCYRDKVAAQADTIDEVRGLLR